MKTMTMQETADYLETATIEHTHDIGHAVAHIGTSAAGVSFVLVNDLHGQTVVVDEVM